MVHKPGEQRHARTSPLLCVVAFLAVAAGCSDSRSRTASADLRAPSSGAESDGLVIRFYRDDGTEEAKFYRSDYRSIASTGAAFPRHPVMLVVNFSVAGQKRLKAVTAEPNEPVQLYAEAIFAGRLVGSTVAIFSPLSDSMGICCRGRDDCEQSRQEILNWFERCGGWSSP